MDKLSRGGVIKHKLIFFRNMIILGFCRREMIVIIKLILIVGFGRKMLFLLITMKPLKKTEHSLMKRCWPMAMGKIDYLNSFSAFLDFTVAGIWKYMDKLSRGGVIQHKMISSEIILGSCAEESL